MNTEQLNFLREIRKWDGIATTEQLGPQTSQLENSARQSCKRKGWVVFERPYWRLTDSGLESLKERERPRIDFSRPGRMISGSKKAPEGHVCVFNSNVCTKSRGKIWFGDIDISDDAEDLRRLAAQEGEEVYILREMDGRFMNEAEPLLHKSVARIAPDGTITVDAT